MSRLQSATSVPHHQQHEQHLHGRPGEHVRHRFADHGQSITLSQTRYAGALLDALMRWPTPVPVCFAPVSRSEEHTSELQSQSNLVCRLLLEKKKRPYPFYTVEIRD